MIREGRGAAGHRVGEGKGRRRDLDGERRWRCAVIWFGRGVRERVEGGRERESERLHHPCPQIHEGRRVGGEGVERRYVGVREREAGGRLSGVRVMCSRYIYKERVTGP
jgi:hypothetical protein